MVLVPAQHLGVVNLRRQRHLRRLLALLLLKELNFKQIECFTIGSDGVIDKAAATSAALKVSLLVGSLRNDPRFGFRWRGPPPKLLLKVVSVGFALTALVPSALSAVDPYAAREVGSG